MDFLELFKAFSSKILPMVYKTITIIPSIASPKTKAPMQDIKIKAFSLIPPPFFIILKALIKTLYKSKIYDIINKINLIDLEIFK